MAQDPAESQPPSQQLRRGMRRTEFWIACILLVGAGGWLVWTRVPEPPPAPYQKKLSHLNTAEEVILELTPHLKRLARDLQNLRLPSIEARSLFADRLKLIDVSAVEPHVTDKPHTTYDVRLREWQLAEPQELPHDRLALWQPLIDDVEYFDRAKFYFVEADLDAETGSRLTAKMGFDALAQLQDGHRAWFHGKMEVAWRNRGKTALGDTADWRIVDWRTVELTSTEASGPLFFRDVTASALDPQVAAETRDSPLDELFIRLVRDQDYRGTDDPDYIASLNWWPAISVVDLDHDGHDDLYFAKNWGNSRFFHNRGDGTFEDRAAEIGLDFDNHCVSSLFADFDNDGDEDVFVGRSLRPSMYLMNENGRFVDRTATHVGTVLPGFTISMSAADYNGDGLLDVYLSTYAIRIAHLAAYGEEPVRSQQRELLVELLGKETTDELLERAGTRHVILDRIGPPNMLLVNRGDGRFEKAPEAESLEVWRNTFQATWSDFDEDGDPDLYVTNDFSSNNLFRNDGERGFTDISLESGTEDIGFGMGSSWGDYDNDGRLDIYTSNMFSKAGRRITKRVPGLDPRFAMMARGNSLLRNLGSEKFEKVSGLEPPTMMVEMAGWSWGSQFVDLDNDGFQDIYALSGNVTFPDEVAFDVDL